MPETVTVPQSSTTAPRRLGRLREARPIDDSFERAWAQFGGSSPVADLVVRYTIGEENSGAYRVTPPLENAFKSLRTRMPAERTEAVLAQLLEKAAPAELVARLIDDQESALLKTRVVTLLPRLKERYNVADLETVLARLATHADSEVRYVVADALAEFPGATAVALLQALAADPIEVIRTVAREGLAELG